MVQGAWNWLPRTAGLTLAMLLPVGCGVGTYEERMRQTQERLARLDEEDALLAEPFAWPPSVAVPVFLRPPRSVVCPPLPVPGSDWLLRCPWAEANVPVPPWEMFVGVYAFSGDLDRLEVILQNELPLGQANGQRIQEPLALREVVFTRAAARPDDQLPVTYRRFVVLSEENPVGSMPRRPSSPMSSWFRWEVYIHAAEDWHIVVAFKVLDREATERFWAELGAPASELRRLPVVDRKLFGRQRDACLATLRVGEPARRAWREWTGHALR